MNMTAIIIVMCGEVRCYFLIMLNMSKVAVFYIQSTIIQDVEKTFRVHLKNLHRNYYAYDFLGLKYNIKNMVLL